MGDITKETHDRIKEDENVSHPSHYTWLKDNFKCVDGDFIDNPNRKENVKKWLINNYILDESDFNCNYKADKSSLKDIEPLDMNIIEGD